MVSFQRHNVYKKYDWSLRRAKNDLQLLDEIYKAEKGKEKLTLMNWS